MISLPASAPSSASSWMQGRSRRFVELLSRIVVTLREALQRLLPNEPGCPVAHMPGGQDTSHCGLRSIFLTYCFKHVTRLFVAHLREAAAPMANPVPAPRSLSYLRQAPLGQQLRSNRRTYPRFVTREIQPERAHQPRPRYKAAPTNPGLLSRRRRIQNRRSGPRAAIRTLARFRTGMPEVPADENATANVKRTLTSGCRGRHARRDPLPAHRRRARPRLRGLRHNLRGRRSRRARLGDELR